MTPVGPYETEAAAAAEEMPRAVANLPRTGRRVPGGELIRPLRESRDLQLSFLREACADAGVELGRYDERILTWLCNYEPATVQVVIGLVSRAYANGLRDGSGVPTPISGVPCSMCDGSGQQRVGDGCDYEIFDCNACGGVGGFPTGGAP